VSKPTCTKRRSIGGIPITLTPFTTCILKNPYLSRRLYTVMYNIIMSQIIHNLAPQSCQINEIESLEKKMDSVEGY